jgi:hypothetical protein
MLDFDVGLQETRRAPNSPKRKAVRLKRKKGRISATRTSAGSGLGHRTIFIATSGSYFSTSVPLRSCFTSYVKQSTPPNGSRKHQYSISLDYTCLIARFLRNPKAQPQEVATSPNLTSKSSGTPSLLPSTTNTPSTMPLLAGQAMMSYKYLLYKSTTIVIPAAIALALPQPVAEPRRPRCEPTATTTTSSTGSQSAQPKS